MNENELVFSYDSYSYADHKLSFTYSYRTPEHEVIGSFTEWYKLPVTIDPADSVTAYILQQLHVVIGTSYYKSLLGPVQLPYALDSTEAEYWNTVYDNGYGEYAYNNNLTEPIRPFTATAQAARESAKLELSGALLGVGGGKDSIVAAEILKGIGIDTTTLDVASRDNHGQAGPVMDAMKLPQLRVERYLDTSISEFTRTHNGLRGHIPLSAILAWLGVLVAYTTGKKYVVMANEAASSVGNTVWSGRVVNHQWSKSFEFERLTQSFIHSHVSGNLWYFSPIRAYGSLAVMELFAKLGSTYLQDFTSCNLVLRIDPATRPNGRWCTHCAKCLSTWLLLSTWLPTDQLERIFGRNLFDDTTLQPLLRQLIGLEGHKPLDCVGTTEELRAATRTTLAHNADAALLAGIESGQIPGPSTEDLVQTTGESSLPPELQPSITSFVQTKLN